MRAVPFLMIAAAAGVGVGIWLALRSWKSKHVSDRWLVEQERSTWGLGIEQGCMSWPINKLANEDSHS